jgi:signal peptidase I
MIDPAEAPENPIEPELEQPSSPPLPVEVRIKSREERRHRLAFSTLQMLKSLLFAIVLALIIRATIVSAFIIPSGSMKDTLLVGDVIVVNRFVYRFTPPQRGDLVVFRQPQGFDRYLVGNWLSETWLSFTCDSPIRHQDLVKRVIGLPGDVVSIAQGRVYITSGEGNSYHLGEPYLPEPFYDNWGPKKVPEGQYLVLGDNRNHSSDGRWFGFIPQELISGRALFVALSITPDTCRDNNLFDSRCDSIVVPLPNNDLAGYKPELPGGNGKYWVCPSECIAGGGQAYRDWYDKHAGPVWERIRWSRIGKILISEGEPTLESYP